MLDYWKAGRLKDSDIERPDGLEVEDWKVVPDCKNNRRLEYWKTGKLEYWKARILEG